MTASSNPNRSSGPDDGSSGHDNHESDGDQAGKLVVLSTFENSVEAHMFRNELESHGIDAKVGNETSTAIFGATIGGSSSAFWIEVLIMESDSARGLEIKQRWAKRQQEEVVEVPEWNCKCGETVDAGFAMCWNCDANYEAPETT